MMKKIKNNFKKLLIIAGILTAAGMLLFSNTTYDSPLFGNVQVLTDEVNYNHVESIVDYRFLDYVKVTYYEYDEINYKWKKTVVHLNADEIVAVRLVDASSSYYTLWSIINQGD